MEEAIGICVGAATITVARRTGGDVTLRALPNEGQVGETLARLCGGFGPFRLGLTGRKFRDRMAIPTISEPEAVELAVSRLRTRYPETDCIVSAGSESFVAYSLDTDGRISDVHSGNRCAAGTGEFFLQQIRRIGLGIEEALALAADAPPYTVAGRCSVFCKSDCTHALNKGVPRARVVAGLCRMMANKVVELVKKSRARQVALVGGASRNRVLLSILRETFPGLVVPAEAVGFEAVGALLWAEQCGVPMRGGMGTVTVYGHSFPSQPPISRGMAQVTFHDRSAGDWITGEYVCGLDVGSTTTKAVLVRSDNRAIVARTYLRTNGDPLGASRSCYRQLLDQLPTGISPRITGLGVTGSGRQIAGLHALTDGVVNEIVAHATAAVYFDPNVETIFEIGGQDAKYTGITHGVATDYTMNEACSAGTGSFLEEACREALGIGTEEIGGLALQSLHPPDFSDQCAAFIGSDIRTAVQEGIGPEDVAAGLVYSICQNYLNRVKGNRPVGRKILMQGGVCYNRAVPAAMALLCGRQITVPPEPGLMGAFGAALEVLRQQDQQQIGKQTFDLAELAKRRFTIIKPFVCTGHGGCDLKCTINRVVINGRTYPFGGSCSRYDRRHGETVGQQGEDLASLREEMVFRTYAPDTGKVAGPAVGILPSLFGSTFYPLYAHFFADLGLRVVLPDRPDPEGMEAAGAPFCQPVLLSHGYLRRVLDLGVDYLFLPHVKNIAMADDRQEANCTCPLVQGEPYCLAAAFTNEASPRFLTPVLEFHDERALRRAFVHLGRVIGFPAGRSRSAFDRAWNIYQAMRREMAALGKRFLENLPADATAIVLFGRPYTAFSRNANMGIPHKFAGQGYPVIPHEFLSECYHAGDSPDHMYWTTGRHILRVAGLVRKHPALFGVYITSFSCGPDSFLLGYFREQMGRKPTLTLELDAHTSDAGVDTRVEAYLDVVRNYRESSASGNDVDVSPLVQAGTRRNSRDILSSGRSYDLTSPGVLVLIPSMGINGSRALVAAFRYTGIDAVAAPPPGRDELSLGKAVATCKECLPLLLTVGSLRRYLQGPRPEEVLFYIMPGSDGPCRFGQYQVFLQHYLEKHHITDVALLGASCENGYAGLPRQFTRRAWQAICIADGLDELEASVRALARHPATALDRLEQAKERIFASLARDNRHRILAVIEDEMADMARIPRRFEPDEAVRISLVGEIYVRHDGFSRQHLVERLADRGIVVHTAPYGEWFHYCDHCAVHRLASNTSFRERWGVRLEQIFKQVDQRAIRKFLVRSGYIDRRGGHSITRVVNASSRLLNPALATEASLTVGTTLLELGKTVHGVISIGPFGCMPCRIADAVLSKRRNNRLDSGQSLPFLAIETDGTVFSQLVEARLESFLLAAQRLRDRLVTADRG